MLGEERPVSPFRQGLRVRNRKRKLKHAYCIPDLADTCEVLLGDTHLVGIVIADFFGGLFVGAMGESQAYSSW